MAPTVGFSEMTEGDPLLLPTSYCLQGLRGLGPLTLLFHRWRNRYDRLG